jgi:hypothetical protein
MEKGTPHCPLVRVKTSGRCRKRAVDNFRSG